MEISLTAKLKSLDAFLDEYVEGDEKASFEGKSLLFFSMSNNDPDNRYKITSFLIERGADVCVLNEHDENLLHILLSRVKHNLPQTIELCRKLISAGVDINQLDNKRRVPLQYLIGMKYHDDDLEPLYDIWFGQTVEMHIPNAWGKTPVQLAEMLPYRVKLLQRMKEHAAQ